MLRINVASLHLEPGVTKVVKTDLIDSISTTGFPKLSKVKLACFQGRIYD